MIQQRDVTYFHDVMFDFDTGREIQQGSEPIFYKNQKLQEPPSPEEEKQKESMSSHSLMSPHAFMKSPEIQNSDKVKSPNVKRPHLKVSKSQEEEKKCDHPVFLEEIIDLGNSYDSSEE